MRWFLIALGLTAYLSVGMAIWVGASSAKERRCPGEGQSVPMLPLLIWPPIVGGALIALMADIDVMVPTCKRVPQ